MNNFDFVRLCQTQEKIGLNKITLLRWEKVGLPIWRRKGQSFVSIQELEEFIRKNFSTDPREKQEDRSGNETADSRS